MPSRENVLKLASIAAAALCAAPAFAQQWDYISYNAANQPAFGGTFTLREGNSAEYRATLVFPEADACWGSDVTAAFRREGGELFVTMAPLRSGCPDVRMVLKVDGSGGRREIRRGDAWVWDQTQRGLKLRPVQ